MNEIVEWLEDQGVNNPHLLNDEQKKEYKRRFPPDEYKIFWPQPGGQEQFSNSSADVVVYGGEAGGGKTWNLVFDHSKWLDIYNYVGAIVRKTYTLFFDAGGIHEEAKNIYEPRGGHLIGGQKPRFQFPSGSKIYYKHSQHAQKVDKYWQGIQAAVISIDELTQFEKNEFLYICSRNRSMCGVRPYIRCTCNPDPDSWVCDFIAWWIDDDGWIIPERCGKIRYFIHHNDKFIFGDNREELKENYPDCKMNPMSITFIKGNLDDNKELLAVDPEYRSRLEMQSEDIKHALSRGNWKHRANPNRIFQPHIVNKYRVEREKVMPQDMSRIVIGVDPSGGDGEEHSDMVGIVICGIRMERDGLEHGYVWKDVSGHYSPEKWAMEVSDQYDLFLADKVVAESNFGGEMVRTTILTYDKNMNAELVRSSKGKYLRAEPVAALYNRGLIHHVGHDLGPLEKEMFGFKKENTKSPNRVDALTFAFTDLLLDTNQKIPTIRRVGPGRI